jgi:hypothetical protein
VASFDRSKVAGFQALLKFDVRSPKYDVFPPILFPDGEKDFKLIFKVVILAKVSSV